MLRKDLQIRAIAALLAAGASLVVFDARADDVRELKTNLPIDAAFTATAIGLVIGSELGKPDLIPAQCRWCGLPCGIMFGKLERS